MKNALAEMLTDAKQWNQRFGRHWWVVDWQNPSDQARHSMAEAGSELG